MFSFLIAPTGYIVKIIVSGNVSIEELGILYGIISFVTILAAYNDFGMTESMNYFLPEFLHKKEKKKATQLLYSALSIQMITSLILGIILFFVAPWLAEHYFHSPAAENLLKIFILFFFWENLFKTITTFFQAAQNPKLQKWAEFVRMITLVAYIIWVFVLEHGSLLNYAWWWIIALATGVLFSFVWLLASYRDVLNPSWLVIEKAFLKTLLWYALWVVLTANAATILSQIDMQMIIALLGPTEAGYYTNYLSIMRIPFMFLLPGVVFLFPVISDLYKKWDIAQIQSIRKNAYKYFSVFAIMTSSFFFLFGPELATMLFSSTYEKSWHILLFSSLFLVFNFLLQIDFQIFSWTGRPKQKMYILLIGIVLNFFTNLFFIHYFGVFGAALATGIGWVVIWLCSIYRVGKEYSFWFDVWFFLKNFIVFSGLSLLYYGSDLSLAWFNRPELIGVFIAVITLYWIAFAAVNAWELRKFYQIVRQRW